MSKNGVKIALFSRVFAVPADQIGCLFSCSLRAAMYKDGSISSTILVGKTNKAKLNKKLEGGTVDLLHTEDLERELNKNVILPTSNRPQLTCQLLQNNFVRLKP